MPAAIAYLFQHAYVACPERANGVLLIAGRDLAVAMDWLGCEDTLDLLPLVIRNEVSVTSDHLLGLMAHPSVDRSLIYTGRGTIGAKGVTEDMPASKLVPIGACERAFEMIMGLVASQRGTNMSSLRATASRRLQAERLIATGMIDEPVAHDRQQ